MTVYIVTNPALICICYDSLLGYFAYCLPSSSPGIFDFEAALFQLSFPAGQTRAEVNITIVDDSLIERMEFFRVHLSIPNEFITKGVQLGPNPVATVTIVDNG